MGAEELLIKILGDSSSAEKALKKTEQSTTKTNKTFDKLKKNFLAIGAGAAAAVIAFNKFNDMAKGAAKFQQSVEAMSSQFGKNAGDMISKLRKASGETISNAQLVEAANRAMSLNVTRDTDKMAKLLEVARVRARAMGIDTTQAFNDIVTGIGRASPMILDNLGIISKGWAEEAKAAGVAFDSQFILNKVLEDGAGILAKTGPLVATQAEKMQQFDAAIENAKLSIGQALLPIMAKLAEILKVAAEGFSELPSAVQATIAAVAILVPALIALNAAFGPVGVAIAAVAAVTIGAIYYTKKFGGEALTVSKNFNKAEEEIVKTTNAIDGYIEILKNIDPTKKNIDVTGGGKIKAQVIDIQKEIDNLDAQILKLKENTKHGMIEIKGPLGLPEWIQATETDIRALQVEIEKLETKRSELVQAFTAAQTKVVAQQKKLTDEQKKQYAELAIEFLEKTKTEIDGMFEEISAIDNLVKSNMVHGEALKRILKYREDLTKKINDQMSAMKKESTLFDQVNSKITNAASKIPNDILGMFSSVGDAIGGAVGGAVSTVTGLISAAKGGILGLVSFGAGKIRELVDQYREWERQSKENELRQWKEVELEKTRLTIERLEREKKAAIEAVKFNTAAGRTWTAILAAEEETRVANMDAAEKEKYLAEKAYLDEVAKVQADYDARILKAKKEQFDIEKKIKIAEARAAEQSALANVRSKLFSSKDDELKKEIRDTYADIISNLSSLTFPGAAHGADYVVPSGYPNDTYMQPVSSGEHVKVTPQGADDFGNGMSFNINHITIQANDPRAFGEKLREFGMMTARRGYAY